jgi:hypothetical protein
MDRGRVIADGPRDEVLKALSQAPQQRPAEAAPSSPSSPSARGTEVAS